MTASEPSGVQPPEDDTALLIAALDHYWTWYDGRSQRAFQILNYYLWDSDSVRRIHERHQRESRRHRRCPCRRGLGFTALTALSELYEVYAAALAEGPLAELQSRITGRLGVDASRITAFHGEITRQRQAGIALVFGLSAALDISALLYAVIR